MSSSLSKFAVTIIVVCKNRYLVGLQQVNNFTSHMINEYLN